MHRFKIWLPASVALTALASALFVFAQSKAAVQKPKVTSPRLYIFDCGMLTLNDPTLFGFTKEELGRTEIKSVVPAYLIVHPKGTLMWEAGWISDAEIEAGKGKHPEGSSSKTLKSQMAAIGYAPSDITYLALSHMHSDHTGNANDFAGATWLVHQIERDAMFASTHDRSKGPVAPATYAALKNAKTQIISEKDYDVFGDGTVILQYAPGHTPGSQVLFLKLKKYGPILLAGDLYHLPEEMTMKRYPSFEFNNEQTAASREKVQAFVKKNGAQLWIEHDVPTFEKNKKSPQYYE